jgi:acyl-CoA hydrolase
VYSKKINRAEYKHNTHCIIIFVAMDEDGEPTPVPKWEPTTEEEKQLEAHARKLMALRNELEDEMRQFMG